MALTKVTNDLQDALAAAQPTITSVGTLTGLTVGGTLSSGDITIAVDDTPTLNFKKASSADVLASINVTTDAGSGGKLAIQTKRNGNTPVDRLTIDDDGNVGIGVTPSSEFHVKGDADTIARIEPNNNSGKATLLLSSTGSGDGGIQYDASTNQAHLFSYSAMTFGVGTGNLSGGYPANERMRIDNAGRVTKPYQPCFTARAPQNTSGGGNSNGGTVSSGNLIFAASAFNNGSHYSTSNGRFTAPVTGHYYFSFSLLWDDSGNGTGYIALRKNNSVSLQYGYAYVHDTGQYGYLQVAGGAVVQLNANEYVQVYCNIAGWHIGSESNWAGFLLG